MIRVVTRRVMTRGMTRVMTPRGAADRRRP
jgi:hypothetical protein